jgi:lysophospholipase L1-like esterase
MLGAMKTLLCFGDSNTHGTVPMQSADEVVRHGFAQRWPGVLRSALGANWCVVEEGLPGRTTSFDDPDEGDDRNARRYWQACLQSHRPLDAIVIMLGTNDLKTKFGASPQTVAEALGHLIDIARLNTPPQSAHPLMLLVAPVPILELSFFRDVFAGGASKSRQLAATCARVAAQRGVHFLDAAAHCSVSTIDGIHLDGLAHQRLGAAIASSLITSARIDLS